MREETVTKNILNWLEKNGWTVVCYDFPQSGTGILLHPNNAKRTNKNKGGIIPDIIAVKSNTALFFENKDRFYESDFNKLNKIKTEADYTNAFEKLLDGLNINTIYFGVGLPFVLKYFVKSKAHLSKIDFLLSTNEKKEVLIHYDPNAIFDAPNF